MRALARRVRDRARARGAEAPRQLRRLRDPDPRAGEQLRRLPARPRRLDRDRPAQQVRAVELELDVERLRQLARARAELLRALEAAAGAHDVESVERLERADQHRSADALLLADRVEQGVDAVGAVDVGARRRPEEDVRAARQPDVGVTGGLGLVVGLGLDDRARGLAVAQHAADEVAGDVDDGAGVEVAVHPSSSARRAGQLLADAVQRRAALGHLRLEPRALGEHGVELVVELGRVARELLAGQVRQRAAGVDRLAHEPRHDAVRLAERHAAAHEQVGDVGGGDQLVGGGRGEALAVEGDPLEHPARRRQRELERVDGVEEVLLVLLHVLVVGQRQPVHDPVEADEVRDHPRRLGAQQLGGVGVLLLRHDRRARRPGVGDLAEPELLARPQHELGPEAREVGRAGGRRAEVVEHEVAVGDGVDRVRRDGGEAELGGQQPAVGVEVHARQRARAERQLLRRLAHEREAPRVAAEHPEVGEQVVGEVDGLGALEVRVAGHRPVEVALGEREQRRAQRVQPRRARASAWARVNRTRSVATWSLRERAVWSLPPTGPTSSVSRRSTAMWMSTSSGANGNVPPSSSRPDLIEPAQQRIALVRRR